LGFRPGGPRSFQGRTEATTGVVAGKAREAHAVTTIDRLDLLGGMVTLVDLRWEATQRSGEGERSDGGFTVGSVLLQGKPLPGAADRSDRAGAERVAAARSAGGAQHRTGPDRHRHRGPPLRLGRRIAQVSPMSLRFADSALAGSCSADLWHPPALRDPIVGGLLAASATSVPP